MSHDQIEAEHQGRAQRHLEGVTTLSSVLQPDVAEHISAVRESRATGFEPLDQSLSGGFAPEDLVIVAGRPGIGKSVAVVQWARNLAREGRRVTLACYEHSEVVMMAQLLLLELGGLAESSIDSAAARRVVDELLQGRRSWMDTVNADRLLVRAASGLAEYAPNLLILDSHGRGSGFEVVERAATETDVLVVDHIGKLGGSSIGQSAMMCKDLAIAQSLTVIATTLLADAGVASRRIRSSEILDAAAISHEADVEIMLNDKFSIVSKNHTAFDSVRADTFRSQVVFSIEKNRRGLAGIDIEFQRDFAHRRFDPVGAFVTERLIDNVLVIE